MLILIENNSFNAARGSPLGSETSVLISQHKLEAPPSSGKFCGRVGPGSRCALAQARVVLWRDSSRYCVRLLPFSIGSRSFPDGATTRAALYQLEECCFSLQSMFGIPASVFHQQEKRLPQALQAFLFRSTLTICLGHFGAKSNIPLAFAMQLGTDWKIHLRITMCRGMLCRKARLGCY